MSQFTTILRMLTIGLACCGLALMYMSTHVPSTRAHRTITPAPIPISIPPLVSAGPAPLVTTDDFKQYLAYQVPPGAQSPQSSYHHLLHALVHDALIARFVHDQGLDSTPQFQERQRLAHAQVDRQLRMELLQEYAQQTLAAQITDEQARSFYLTNRATLRIFQREPFVLTAGTVTAAVVSGLTRAHADTLAKQAVSGGLARAASKRHLTVTPYTAISIRSPELPLYVRQVLHDVPRVPFYTVAPIGANQYAVIQITELTPPTYKPYTDPAVRTAVTELMLRDRLADYMMQLGTHLMQTYSVVIHEDVLDTLIQDFKDIS